MWNGPAGNVEGSKTGLMASGSEARSVGQLESQDVPGCRNHPRDDVDEPDSCPTRRETEEAQTPRQPRRQKHCSRKSITRIHDFFERGWLEMQVPALDSSTSDLRAFHNDLFAVGYLN